MDSVLGVAIPAVVFFVMTIVGLDVTPEDLRRISRRPGLILGATLAQAALLPLLALGLMRVLDPGPGIALGLLLLAVCPGGGISNYYTYLARANTALSIVLTTVSSLAALGTMPVLLHLLPLLGGRAPALKLPVAPLLAQLLILMTLPVLLGMGIRRLWPRFVQRCEPALRQLSVIAIAALIALVLWEGAQTFARDWPAGALASALFVAASMAAGYATAAAFALKAADRLTLLIEFGVRNAALPAAMAVTLLHQFDLAVMMTVYFLTQAPLMLAWIPLYRWAIHRRSGVLGASLQQS
jgi:BASS family bile acid:Na+ symporter